MKQLIKISQVKSNPNNPRLIKNDKFKKLVKSVQDFPEMLELRPIVVDENMIVLGGNMRLKACIEAGLKEVWIEVADLTEQQKKEFTIKDNVGFGEWEWDMLANEWEQTELEDWGLDGFPFEDNKNYSDKNKEIDIDAFDDQMIIKLKYSEDEYNLVREQLSKIASTPEQAVWKLLGNE
jgi:ParB-like chromosome segregation protein Spo0J